MSFEDDPRRTVGSDPIPGDAPAGANVRYEPIYDQLADMIAKMESGGAGAVPWNKVAETSIEILREHSKDILVGAYAAYSLYRTEGFTGLAIGLKIVRDMVDTYWEDLQPPKKRERARVSAVEWLAERLAPMVTNIEIAPADGPAVMAAFAALSELDDLMAQKLETESVALGELTRPLRDLNRSAEEAQAAAASAPPPTDSGTSETADGQAAPAAPAATATAPTPAAPTPAAPASAAPAAAAPAAPAAGTAAAPRVAAAAFNSADLDRSINDMQHSLRSFAEALRAANSADPRAYWLLRASVWLPVTQPPPAEGGRTLLPEMASDVVIAMESQLKAGDFAGVLNAAENNLVGAPFWLAAHRFSAAALAQMGSTHADARAVVVGELAALLRRFPTLPEMHFSSGAPFADDATAAWIRDEVMAGSAGGGGGDGAPGAWDAAMVEARQAAAKGNVNDGFGIFSRGRQSSPGARGRFLWDLRLAEYAFENGEVLPAARLLETLDDEFERLGLAEWEPDIGLQVAVQLLKCYAKAGDRLGAGEGTAAARVAKLQAIVSRLDMTKAVSLMTP